VESSLKTTALEYADVLLDARREAGLEVNAAKIKHTFMS
jgi:hypothetical protein